MQYLCFKKHLIVKKATAEDHLIQTFLSENTRTHFELKNIYQFDTINNIFCRNISSDYWNF